jgi:hypothetical protein
VAASEPVCANAEAATGNVPMITRKERSHWYRMRIHSILQDLLAAPSFFIRALEPDRKTREISPKSQKGLARPEARK